MSEYKLVPVKPTAEMVKAARDSYMRFGYMELSIRAALLAAPAVDGEPKIEPYDAGSLNDFGGGDVGWWHDYIRAELDRAYEFYLVQLSAAPQPAEQQPALAKYQPCGCVVCTCEHETQCQGCGAHHCGTHPLGQIPGPVYQQPAPDVKALVEALEAMLEVRVVEADASYGLACAKAEHALAPYRKGAKS